MNRSVSQIMDWDRRLLTACFFMPRLCAWNRWVRLISRSADGYGYPVIAVFFLLFHAEGLAFLHTMLLAFAIELPVYRIIKIRVRRSRPFHVCGHIRCRMPPPDCFSFPSGHTAGAFVMATILFGIVGIMAAPFYFWACMVGVSRVYLGVHYPTDVVAGMTIGTASALSAMYIIGVWM